MKGYGYHLNDSIKTIVAAHPQGLTITQLTEKLNGFLQLNYSPKTYQYKMLRRRTRDRCTALSKDGIVTLTPSIDPETKTTYQTVTPTPPNPL